MVFSPMFDRISVFRMVACCAMWLQPGCGDDTVGCVAGASSACTCTNGASGAQICRDDGTYGSCTCDGSSVGEQQTSDASREVENERSGKNNSTSDRDDKPAPKDSSSSGSDASVETSPASSDRDDTTTPEGPTPDNDTADEEPTEVDPKADCETFPVNLTQSTTIAPGCYRVIAPPSFAEGADLTISRGVTLYFDEGTWLEVPEGSILIAHGTEANPIIFQGASAEPGYWGGIRLIGAASFDYATIQYAGGSIASDSGQHRAALSVDGLLALTNSRITHSAGYGVRNQNHIGIIEFGNNTLTANQRPLLLNALLVSHLGLGNEFSGNDVDEIDITTEVSSQVLLSPSGRSYTGVQLVESHTWSDFGVPYRLLNTLLVNASASLTLGKGVSLSFVPATGLIVDGALAAAGTEQAPVRLTADDPSVGWLGVVSCTGDISVVNTQIIDVAPDSTFLARACLSEDGILFTP